MFYHVIIWREPSGELVHRAPNLGWSVIADRVLPSYDLGNSITLGGRTIEPWDIGGMKILETEDRVNPMAPALDDDYLRLTGFTYSDSEHDITDEWIVGPPGHLAERSKGGENEPQSWPQIFDALIKESRIRSASRQLFADGHYQNAVEDAFKALDEAVAHKSGVVDSGTNLMRKAFHRESPVLALTQLQTESDRGIQEGYGHLFAGSMLAIRNPRTHGLSVDHPDEAMELIAWAHHLMRKLQAATKTETDLPDISE